MQHRDRERHIEMRNRDTEGVSVGGEQANMTEAYQKVSPRRKKQYSRELTITHRSTNYPVAVFCLLPACLAASPSLLPLYTSRFSQQTLSHFSSISSFLWRGRILHWKLKQSLLLLLLLPHPLCSLSYLPALPSSSSPSLRVSLSLSLSPCLILHP